MSGREALRAVGTLGMVGAKATAGEGHVSRASAQRQQARNVNAPIAANPNAIQILSKHVLLQEYKTY